MDRQTTANPRRYLRYSAVAEYTGLSRHTIWRATRRAELSPIRVGTAVVFDVADVDRFMAQRKNNITGNAAPDLPINVVRGDHS
jgi:excisionase family DNA binding protein